MVRKEYKEKCLQCINAGQWNICVPCKNYEQFSPRTKIEESKPHENDVKE